jgi:hypothetical protein
MLINNRTRGSVIEFIGIPVTSTANVRNSGAAALIDVRRVAARRSATTVTAAAARAATFLNALVRGAEQ